MRRFKKGEFTIVILMILVVVLWGGSFIAQSSAAKHMPPLSINAFRFCFGGLITFSISKVFDRFSPKETQGYSLDLMGAGIITGLVFSFGIGLQQVAMVTSTAGNGGAISNMDVVFLPLLVVIFFRRKLAKIIWFAILIAIAGLALISFGNQRFASGDLIMLVVAITVATRILLLNKYITNFDPLKVATIFFLTTGVSSTFASVLIGETPTLSQVSDAAPELIYLTLLCTAFGYTVETIGLKILDPVRIGFITNLEAVFATLGGWLLLNESIDLGAFVGFLLIFAAIAIATLNRVDINQELHTETN